MTTGFRRHDVVIVKSAHPTYRSEDGQDLPCVIAREGRVGLVSEIRKDGDVLVSFPTLHWSGSAQVILPMGDISPRHLSLVHRFTSPTTTKES